MNRNLSTGTSPVTSYVTGRVSTKNRTFSRLAGRIAITMAALAISVFSLSAQQRNVTGTVSDDNGNPIPGANVSIKGTNQATIADAQGAYSISVPQNDAVLTFAFIGFLPQETPVGSRTSIDVTLRPDVQGIEDVVVIGYGTMQKKQVTSSIQSIGGGDLPIGVGGASIATALQGKVAGLVMSQSDSPNSDNLFQLRGMASVNTSRAPLIVIDGMPGGDIRSLMPEEIQSIDVLKDASAGAIYGTRATGGVILITTKQAKTGRATISYTGEVMLKQAFGAPDLLKGQDYLEATGKVDAGGSTDWWNEALNDNPISHRHIVTMEGGVDNARILAVLGYDRNVGIMRGDDRTDLSGRLNADFKFLDGWLEIGTHLSYRQADRNRSRPSIPILLRANPTQPLYDPNSDTGWNIYKSGADSNNDDHNTIGDAALKTREGLHKWFRPDVSVKVNIKPIKGLSYRQTAAYENRQQENHEYDPSTVLAETNANRKGRAKLEFRKEEYLNADGYFSYINDFNNHSINATAGYSYFERNAENFNAENFDFSNDGVGIWDIGEGSWLASATRNPNMGSHKDITERLMAYFARANWSYDDRYMATASIRHEGSSKFGANNRWGTFWAISAGWRLSSEAFMEDVSWVDDLKLRAAYGVTGNEGFDAAYEARMYGRASERWLMPDGQTWAYGYGVANNINPDLGWEEKREWNIGLDFSLFNDRLYGSFDWYRRKIHGLIFNVDVPQPPYDQDKMYKNIGSLRNLGWELILGGDIIRGKDWNWSSNMNLSQNKTEVSSLWGNRSAIPGWAPHQWFGPLYRLEEGGTIGDFWLLKHAGISEEGNLQVYKADGSVIDGSAAGDDDRIYQGNFMPKLIVGWSHSISYKNLNLDFTLTSWLDYDVMNVFEMFYGMNSSAIGNNRTYDAIRKNKDIKTNAVASDYFLYDATFLKLQNLTLGYTLPMAKRTNNMIQNIKVYFTGTNLFRITNYPGLNPEVDITGWEGGSERPSETDRRGIYPQTRTFTLGAQLTF